ncbi:uncharacterized protein DS421_5g135530 [Arachis hypogaea]|nr:uncharacterized protein DS421_5g135530 [Arachis hypogaea]
MRNVTVTAHMKTEVITEYRFEEEDKEAIGVVDNATNEMIEHGRREIATMTTDLNKLDLLSRLMRSIEDDINLRDIVIRGGGGGGKGTAAPPPTALPPYHNAPPPPSSSSSLLAVATDLHYRRRSSLPPPLCSSGKEGRECEGRRGGWGFRKKRGKGKGPRCRHWSSWTPPIFAAAATAAPSHRCTAALLLVIHHSSSLN